VSGLLEIKENREGVCGGCAKGKNVKNPFPSSDNKAKGILDIIHSDVCGPMAATSLSEYVYYVTFIDDFSRKCWIYFLKAKDEVLSKFKEFKALTENHSEKRIKTLRSDNVGEFTSGEFNDLCKEAGIKRELTTYNPKQNGVAERKNRTIMEAVKAMLYDQDLPMYLWAEAARTTVFVQNRMPHREIGNKTPNELFTGKKPEVSHLRIFGCPVYVHVPKDNRSKLDPSGKKGVFVGYSDSTKGYRVHFPGLKKIEVSPDVVFDEDVAFSRSRKRHANEDAVEEPVTPRISDAVTKERSISEEYTPEDHDDLEPQRPVDPPKDMITYKRRPAWVREAVEDAERYRAPEGSSREKKRPKIFSSYVALLCGIIDKEPSSFEEAAENKVWQDAMNEEYKSIMENVVWDIVPRPKGKSVVTSKWIYKTKRATYGSIEKYKARFVARGFSQKEGIDHEETFAPVARYTSIRAILAITTIKKWKLHQMDVKTTFLNGVVEEEVYLEQPLGFETHDRQTHVCRLKKALYGLKQAPRTW